MVKQCKLPYHGKSLIMSPFSKLSLNKDYTKNVQDSCSQMGCNLPSLKNVKNGFWAVCYECDEERNKMEKRGGNYPDFIFPETAEKIAGKSIKEQKSTLKHYRDRDDEFKRNYLTRFGNSVFQSKSAEYNNIGNRIEGNSVNVTNLMKYAEKQIGIMTNILREDQSLTFDIDQGHISLVKTGNLTSGNIFEGVDDSVILPNQNNLRNSDGKIVAAIFVHNNLSMENLASKIISVSVFETRPRTTQD